MTTERPPELEEDHLTFLDDLRDSGETNMYGAGSYLMEAFFLEKAEAGRVLSYWMATFGERQRREVGSE